MMIGGEDAVVKRLDPIFARLAPGAGDVERTPGREKVGGTAEQGYLHCGPNGAGHFDIRSEEHTSELQSHSDLVCRLLLEKKKKYKRVNAADHRDTSCMVTP